MLWTAYSKKTGLAKKCFQHYRNNEFQQLIQQQLEQHEESLSLISEQLKRSALFYDHELAYEYRMHPGWIQETTVKMKEILPLI